MLWAADQSDSTCCFESSALAVTEYVPGADQAWDIVADVPLGTGELQSDL
jgi:hypothetical protein